MLQSQILVGGGDASVPMSIGGAVFQIHEQAGGFDLREPALDGEWGCWHAQPFHAGQGTGDEFRCAGGGVGGTLPQLGSGDNRCDQPNLHSMQGRPYHRVLDCVRAECAC